MSELSLLRAEVSPALREFCDARAEDRDAALRRWRRSCASTTSSSPPPSRRRESARARSASCGIVGLQERHAVQRRAPPARRAVGLPDGRQRAHPRDRRQPAADRQGGLSPWPSSVLATAGAGRVPRRAASTPGLLIDSGVPGRLRPRRRLRATSARASTRSSRAAAAADGPSGCASRRCCRAAQLEKIGYLNSFPHLAGSVFAFDGRRGAGARAGGARRAAHEDWSEFQEMTDLVPDAGRLLPGLPGDRRARAAAARRRRSSTPAAPGSSATSPPSDPARLQMFHQREIVRIGEPDDGARLARRVARPRGLELLRGLGLDAELRRRQRPVLRPQRAHARRQPARRRS